MHKDFLSLGEIIKNEPGLEKLRNVIKENDTIIDFNKIFPKLEKLVKPFKVSRKTLFLKVENSVCRSELKFKEKIIMDRINDYYKEKRINSIKFLS